MHRLVLVQAGSVSHEVALAKKHLRVGRSEDNEIVLRDRFVSRWHAAICQEGSDFVITDTRSTFGTYFNDMFLEPGVTRVLRDGDVLRFGNVRAFCHFDSAEQEVSEATNNARFAAQARARLIIVDGEFVQRRPLAGTMTVLGTSPHCDIRLGRPSTLSELAVIRVYDCEYYIEPRVTDAPLLLNETRIPLEARTSLATSSVFCIGDTQVLFLYDYAQNGCRVADPLKRLSPRKLLHRVALQSGLSFRTLRRHFRGWRVFGQDIGELLVGRGVITPLSWRVIYARIVSSLPDGI